MANARGGVFCAYHEDAHGALCHVRDCNNLKVNRTRACQAHQDLWYQHTLRYGRQTLLGFTRLLRRSETENQPWLPQHYQRAQPHDQQPAARRPRATYFQPTRIYCVETICAPCGVVIAWTKFSTAESPTNILEFLETVYPSEESRPDFICIDKACLVLRTSIANGSWDSWKNTTRFIVDSYHYINHRVQDYICRKWCNPAPLNGSQPNLVIIERDQDNVQRYKRAFNTQVSIFHEYNELLLG